MFLFYSCVVHDSLLVQRQCRQHIMEKEDEVGVPDAYETLSHTCVLLGVRTHRAKYSKFAECLWCVRLCVVCVHTMACVRVYGVRVLRGITASLKII